MRARSFVAAGVALCALTLAACGEDDFPNDPRPPAPIELSARIGDDGITVSPGSVGAGLATITISNQTPDPTRLVLEGPTDDASPEIGGGNTGAIKIGLEEGDYTVSDGEGGPETQLSVGPERESSQNDLLLP